GGPTIRAATALDIDVMDLWVPMIPVQIIGMLCVVLVSVWLGKKEKTRLGLLSENEKTRIKMNGNDNTEDPEVEKLKRPKLLILNLLLTIAVIVVLIMEILPLAVTFVVGVPLALMINY